MQQIRKLFSRPFYDNSNTFERLWYKLKGVIFYRHVFGSFGKGSVLYSPMLVTNPRYIHIGENTIIRPGVRIEAVVLDPANPPEIRIGNNVNIEQNVHIVAVGKIYIHDNASLTAQACILGATHPFLDIHNPMKIGDRLGGSDSITVIGEGCFLGVGSVIQMNVSLGRHVVVGSNAVVTKSFPAYSIIAGAPARLLQTYDDELKTWIRSS